MRELKFKAWLKFEKKFKKVKMIDFIEEKIWTGANWYDFDDIELIEYTGLKDRNAVKIFEGDIVNTDEAWKPIFMVEWDKEMGKWRMANDFSYKSLWFVHNYEVIGNIYENPELLEVNANVD